MISPSTLFAWLTPAGAAAIAVVAVHGPEAWPTIRGLFHLPAGRELPVEFGAPGRVWFGHFGAGDAVDEVVLITRSTNSVPWLELQVHGGPQVIAWVSELLAGRGLTACSTIEFFRQVPAFAEVDAIHALTQARTIRTAIILLDQANGAFRRACEEIAFQLSTGQSNLARTQVEKLLSYTELGKRLTQPWRVAIAGPPNVGKSSLMNALAGFQRSVVAAIPGTTRDVVSVELAIDGWPVEFLDMAGLRESSDELERAGIEHAREAIESVDLVLWLMDATEPQLLLPPASIPLDRMLTVANKCDLVNTELIADLRISAKTGAGIGELCEAISRKLVPAPPEPGAAVPIDPRQIAELSNWLRQLSNPNGIAPIPQSDP